MSEKRDYEVGKGKPPKHTQFQKGVCPNRKGRGKANRNMGTIMEAELSQKVKINENGRSRSLTKRELLVKRLVADALGGKLGAVGMLLNFYEKVFGFAPDDVSRENLSPGDKAILEEYARSLITGLDNRG